MAATEIFLNTPVAVGNIGVEDYAAYRLTLDSPVALLSITVTATEGSPVVRASGPGGSAEDIGTITFTDAAAGDWDIEVSPSGLESLFGVELLATAEDGGGGVPTSACFWAEESIVGLVKYCQPPADASTLIAFAPQVHEEGWYIGAGGASYGMFEIMQRAPYFDTALENAASVGTITGVSFIREEDGSGPSSLGALGDPLPDGVIFDPVTWGFPINDGTAYDGVLGAYAGAEHSQKYYYGRVEVGGSTFFGLFAVGGGV